MATETRKVLFQSVPSSATLTAAYTAGASTQAVVSTISVCNQSATATTFRLSVAVGGAADTPAQYIVFDAPLAGNETQAYTIGMTLAATDVVRVYSGNGQVSFVAFGVEIT